MNQELIAVLAAAVSATVAAWARWLRARRTSSGRVGTSDAGVLWQQAQANYAIVLARAEKAEAQRDRLLDAQSSSVVPALAALSEALGHITGSLARIEAALRAGGSGEGRQD